MAAVSGTQWCDPRKTAEVDKDIERIVAAGFNTISLGTFKFMPMYFIDYSKTKFPDAEVFDAKKVEQNVSTAAPKYAKGQKQGH